MSMMDEYAKRFDFIESRMNRLEVLIYLAIGSNIPHLMQTVVSI